jgi:hypothetical protein
MVFQQKLGSKPSGNLQYVYPLVVEINMFQLANHLRIGEPILDYWSRHDEPTKKTRIYLRHDEPKKGMPVEAKKKADGGCRSPKYRLWMTPKPKHVLDMPNQSCL